MKSHLSRPLEQAAPGLRGSARFACTTRATREAIVLAARGRRICRQMAKAWDGDRNHFIVPGMRYGYLGFVLAPPSVGHPMGIDMETRALRPWLRARLRYGVALASQSGASSLEYALIIGGIALAVIAIVNVLGPDLAVFFEAADTKLTAGNPT